MARYITVGLKIVGVKNQPTSRGKIICHGRPAAKTLRAPGVSIELISPWRARCDAETEGGPIRKAMTQLRKISWSAPAGSAVARAARLKDSVPHGSKSLDRSVAEIIDNQIRLALE
jgi:hypothetical protein